MRTGEFDHISNGCVFFGAAIRSADENPFAGKGMRILFWLVMGIVISGGLIIQGLCFYGGWIFGLVQFETWPAIIQICWAGILLFTGMMGTMIFLGDGTPFSQTLCYLMWMFISFILGTTLAIADWGAPFVLTV